MPGSPELLWLVVAIVFGFTLGLLPAFLLTKHRREAARQYGRQELAADLASLQERLNSRDQQLQRQEDELREKTARMEILIQDKTGLERDNARLATELREEIRRSEENLKVLQDAKQELQVQFKNIANQIFEEKTRSPALWTKT